MTFAQEQVERMRQRLQRTSDDTAEKEALDAKLARFIADLTATQETLLSQQESTHAQHQSARKENEEALSRISRIKRQVGLCALEVNRVNKEISSLVSMIERIQGEKEGLIRNCEVEEISLLVKNPPGEEVQIDTLQLESQLFRVDHSACSSTSIGVECFG